MFVADLKWKWCKTLGFHFERVEWWQKYLFLQGNSTKRIDEDMPIRLDDKRPSTSIVKNCVARFRTGHMSPEDEECSGTNSSDNSRKRGCHSFHVPGWLNIHLHDSRDPADILKKGGQYYVFARSYAWESSQPNVEMLFINMIQCLLHMPFWTNFGGILWDYWTIL
jgi:hypothetical protein